MENYLNIKHKLNILNTSIEILKEYDKSIANCTEKLSVTKKKLKEKMSIIENDLKALKGIENELYYEIIVNGYKPTKAVDIVAFKEDIDASTIWKKYYPNVKNKINDFKAIIKDDFV